MTKKSASSNKKKELSPQQKAVAARLYAMWVDMQQRTGLSQEKAAAEMDMTQGALGHYLHGRNALGFEAMFWFAQLLRVHPYEIDPDFRLRLPSDLRDAVDQMAIKKGELASPSSAYTGSRTPARQLHDAPAAQSIGVAKRRS